MRRFLTIFLAIALLTWAVPVSAITVKAEKVEKKDDSKPADKDTAKQPSSEKSQSATKSDGALLDKLRRSVVESKKDETPKYDQFKDANNDGVSDQVPKTETSEAAKPRQEVKPAQPPTKGTPKTKTISKPNTTKKPETTTTKKKKP